MTKPTLEHLTARKEMMDAYRREFYQYFKLEHTLDFNKAQAVRVESLCWQFFLHGKGYRPVE